MGNVFRVIGLLAMKRISLRTYKFVDLYLRKVPASLRKNESDVDNTYMMLNLARRACNLVTRDSMVGTGLPLKPGDFE